MKSRIPLIPFLVCAAILLAEAMWVGSGCTQPQITTTYNTIYSLESATTAAYSGYLDLVVKGQVSTNALPVVSKAFNNFQAAAATATDAANFNTNALAPASLLTLSQDVINEINVAKGH